MVIRLVYVFLVNRVSLKKKIPDLIKFHWKIFLHEGMTLNELAFKIELEGLIS